MKLLIVDDQLATLTGLVEEIDWEKEGITQVASAQNAMEARLVFRDGVPDIMICDIEMPVESGIDLGKWVRKNEYQTRIIFLTCHSEFIYAKKALELRAVDYILQPAPYEEIVEVVRKAIADIDEMERAKAQIRQAEGYEEKKRYIQNSIWRDYLNGRSDQKTSLELLEMPDKNREVRIVLLQLSQWKEEGWKEVTLNAVLYSLLADIFHLDEFYNAIISMETDIYAIVIQNRKDKQITEAGFIQQMQYLNDVFKMYMPCLSSIYINREIPFEELPQTWECLIKRKNSNVAGVTGIVQSQETPEDRKVFRGEQIKQWGVYLCSGQATKVEEGAKELLYQMVQEKELDEKSLLQFYQEFMQMLYSVGEEINGISVSELFHSEEELELYRNGMKSLDYMKDLICHVAREYRSAEMDAGQIEMVETIKKYINSHLNQTIMREDITKRVHLNADYVNRLFKKETGMSVKSYIIQQKMLEARDLLKNTSLPISHIAVRLGYSNFSHFSSSYKKKFGITPLEEKRREE